MKSMVRALQRSLRSHDQQLDYHYQVFLTNSEREGSGVIHFASFQQFLYYVPLFARKNCSFQTNFSHVHDNGELMLSNRPFK